MENGRVADGSSRRDPCCCWTLPGERIYGGRQQSEAAEVRMTSLENRPNTALLVIDVQNGVVGNAFERERVVENIRSLVERARVDGVPVVWVQHSDENLPRDSDAWQYVPELVRRSDEPVVHKTYADSFEETDLEAVLADRAIGRLVVTGAQTEECVRTTLHGALVRGYDATLVSDAHTTEDMREWGFPVTPEQSIAYTNAYWSWASAPGRKGDVVATADLEFSAG
jgi:isochorismate hydrolase